MRGISKEGVWYPAKEKVGLVNRSGKVIEVNGQQIAPEDPYIYEGPDRAFLYQLYEIDKSGKTTTMGQDFRKTPDFLEMVRKLGFASVDSYLEFVGYDKSEAEQKFNTEASEINKHELPKRVKAIKVLGGGRDYSGGGQDRYGNFGPTPKD